jgi:hypothetical protein
MKATIATKQAEHAKANLRCAKIILADPSRYRGLMVEWAKRILERGKC